MTTFNWSNNLVPDLANFLELYYYKILKVNLTDDTFEVIMNTEDNTPSHNCLSRWIEEFAKDNIPQENKHSFEQRTSLEYMRNNIDDIIDFFYTRKTKNGLYLKSEFILFPSLDYEPGKEVGILFIKHFD